MSFPQFLTRAPKSARSVTTSLALAVSLFSLAATAHATTYYVSPTGNDSAAGSSAAPWKTLQKAANSVSAGATVLVENGNYAGFRMRASGTASAPIVFKSVNLWGAKIDATGPLGDVDNVSVQSSSYVTLDSFEVYGSQRAGIGVRTLYSGTGADTRNDIVTHCFCHDNGVSGGGAHDGIFTGFALNFSALDNCCSHNGEHGIYVSNSADNPIISYNHVWDNQDCGIQINADQYTTTGDGTADGLISNWVISNNVIYGNGAGGGSAINLDGAIDGFCYNNLIYDNFATGIAMYQIDGAQASNHNVVCNNTIYDPTSGRDALLLGDGADDNVVFNNIAYSKTGIEVDSVTGLVHDYNRFNNITGATASAHESSPSAASLFINAATWNLELSPTSSALNAGVATFDGKSAPTYDILFTARPQGSADDIGCYEMVQTPAKAAVAPETGPSGHSA